MMNKFQSLMGLMIISLFLIAGCAVTTRGIANNQISKAEEETKANGPKKILGQFDRIDGTEQIVVPITTQSAGRLDYDSAKSVGVPIYNYIFLNRQNLSARKLLPHNQWRIVETQEIGDSVKPTKNQQGEAGLPTIANVKSMWYVVVKKDTNGNKELDAADQQTIALANNDGTNFREVIKDIDRIQYVHNKDKDNRVVVYQVGQQYFAANINIPSKTATVKEMPALN